MLKPSHRSGMSRSSKFVVRSVVAAAFIALFSAAYVAAQEKKEEPADKELESLIRDLRSKDIGTRVNAAKKLAEKGEDAAPVARALCDAVADSSPRVRDAALEAVEKVRPDLYKPLVAMMLDEVSYKQSEAINELGAMGEAAAPCLGVIVAKLRKELAYSRPLDVQTLTKGIAVGRPYSPPESVVKACFKAIREIGADAEAVKLLKSVAGPSAQGAAAGARKTPEQSEARLEAIVALDRWAGQDAKRRKEVLPLLKGALDDQFCRIACIKLLGSYGRLANDAMPQLKKLKLSPDEHIREAANAAIEQIESEPVEGKEKPVPGKAKMPPPDRDADGAVSDEALERVARAALPSLVKRWNAAGSKLSFDGPLAKAPIDHIDRKPEKFIVYFRMRATRENVSCIGVSIVLAGGRLQVDLDNLIERGYNPAFKSAQPR